MGHNLARSHHATSHLSCLQHNYIHAMRGEVQRSRCSQIFTASFKLNDGETQRKKSKAKKTKSHTGSSYTRTNDDTLCFRWHRIVLCIRHRPLREKKKRLESVTGVRSPGRDFVNLFQL